MELTATSTPIIPVHGMLTGFTRRVISVLSSMCDGTFLVARGGDVVYANPSAAELLGVERSQLLGPVAHLEERAPMLRELAHQSLRGATVHPTRETVERSCGAIRYVRASSSPLLDDDGEIAAALIVVADVTPLQQAVLAEHERRLRAERELHEHKDALAAVSHDLRAPLAAVRLGASLLVRTPPEERRQGVKRSADLIGRATDQMRRMIENLLDEAAAESGKLRLSLETACPRRLVADVLGLFEAPAAQGRVELVSRVDPRVAPIVCDRSRVERVLSNLVANALKFSPPGSVVAVDVSDAGTGVRFNVADRGDGIPEELWPHLFDRYWSGTVSSGGTGLGLYVAKLIVEAHRGRIGFESRSGAGTVFSFVLPKVQSEDLGSDGRDGRPELVAGGGPGE